MTVTVKLDPALESRLRQRCAAEGRTASDVIREALSAHFDATPAPKVTAFALGRDLFGRFEGPADLASRRREQVGAWAEARDRARTGTSAGPRPRRSA
jgi:plasmid stability protein